MHRLARGSTKKVEWFIRRYLTNKVPIVSLSREDRMIVSHSRVKKLKPSLLQI